MEIQELINKCERNLENNLVSTAIHDLHDAIYHDNSVHKRADVRLMYARLLGHVGELSETIRTLDELRYESSNNDEYKIKGIIYGAVQWSRLMEYEKAISILTSVNPPSDAEYLVYYHSHLLSIAFEMDDKKSMTQSIFQIERVIKNQKINGIPLQESIIWKTIFETYLKKPFNQEVINNAERDSIEIMNQSGKKSFIPYIYLRIGNLYERLPDKTKALEFYKKAKQQALDGNHGIAVLMINLAMINIENDNRETKRLIKETCVIAGQHGIGLIHCQLSYKIRKLLEQLKLSDQSRCKQWLLTDRYSPDIKRLVDKDFEELCAKLLKSHANDIFRADINVELLKDRHSIIDIEITDAASYHAIKLGVQCKGGKRNWTGNSLKRELQKNSSDLESKFRDLKNEGYNGYIFMCTTDIDDDAKKWLDGIHQNVFQQKCRVLDSREIKGFLRENPQLRMVLATAINK